MKLVLTLRAICDIGGAKARFESEISQGVPHDLDLDTLRQSGGTFTDLGLVEYDRHEYYASLYAPAPLPDDEDGE